MQNRTRSECRWRSWTNFNAGSAITCADVRACIDTTGSANCFTADYCLCTRGFGRTFVASVSSCYCVSLVAAGYPTGGCKTGEKCCPSGCQAAGTSLGTFSVNVATNSWVDTGITLASGQGIAITATATNDRGPAGTVEWNGLGSTATPNGVTSAACGCPPTPCNTFGASVTSDFCHTALIGSVGSTAGPYFLIGSSYAGTPGAGRLYVRQNDTDTGNNRGFFNGTVVTDPCPGYAPASVGEPRVLPPESKYGPGASLKWMLSLAGIVSSPTCPCNARAAEMDSWGELGCLKRLPLIVGWLGEEASKRDLWFWRPAGYALVLTAIALSALARPWRGNNQ